MLMFFFGSLANQFVTRLGEQFFLLLRTKPSWVTWVCTIVETGRRLQVADDDSVSWCERRAHACYFSRSDRISAVRRHWSVLVENSSRSTPAYPESTKDQADQDVQESELSARVPASLCSSAWRCFRNLMRSNKQSFDIAGGVHVGKDDLDVGAGNQNHDSPIVTTGFNVETVEYPNFIFTVCAVGGLDKFCPLWHHCCQNTNGLICVVVSNERDMVEEA